MGSVHTRLAIELVPFDYATCAWGQPATWAEARLAGARRGVFAPFHWAHRDEKPARLPYPSRLVAFGRGLCAPPW